MWVGYMRVTLPTGDFPFSENSRNFRLLKTSTFPTQPENCYVGRRYLSNSPNFGLLKTATFLSQPENCYVGRLYESNSPNW
ncbi:hypothetical protein APPUASWS_029085 [Arthrospira platensis str. Paraca]|nr:hypothetical protein APPUASWS_029085 [Arthrospira platensis str. Paraca]